MLNINNTKMQLQIIYNSVLGSLPYIDNILSMVYSLSNGLTPSWCMEIVMVQVIRPPSSFKGMVNAYSALYKNCKVCDSNILSG